MNATQVETNQTSYAFNHPKQACKAPHFPSPKEIRATSLNSAKQQWYGRRNEFGELTYEENRMAEGIATFDKEELREIAADYMDGEMWEVLEMFRKGFGAQGGSNSDKLKMVSYWCDMIWDEVESRVFSRLVESGEITL